MLSDCYINSLPFIKHRCSAVLQSRASLYRHPPKPAYAHVHAGAAISQRTGSGIAHVLRDSFYGTWMAKAALQLCPCIRCVPQMHMILCKALPVHSLSKALQSFPKPCLSILCDFVQNPSCLSLVNVVWMSLCKALPVYLVCQWVENPKCWMLTVSSPNVLVYSSALHVPSPPVVRVIKFVAKKRGRSQHACHTFWIDTYMRVLTSRSSIKIIIVHSCTV